MSKEQRTDQSLGKFAKKGREIGDLVEEKNIAYGDAFAQSGKILAVLYPDGIRPDQFVDALGVVRVLDKLFRIAARKDAFDESPWGDVAGYGLLGAVRHDEERAQAQKSSEAPSGEAVWAYEVTIDGAPLASVTSQPPSEPEPSSTTFTISSNAEKVAVVERALEAASGDSEGVVDFKEAGVVSHVLSNAGLSPEVGGVRDKSSEPSQTEVDKVIADAAKRANAWRGERVIKNQQESFVAGAVGVDVALPGDAADGPF